MWYAAHYSIAPWSRLDFRNKRLSFPLCSSSADGMDAGSSGENGPLEAELDIIIFTSMGRKREKGGAAEEEHNIGFSAATFAADVFTLNAASCKRDEED